MAARSTILALIMIIAAAPEPSAQDGIDLRRMALCKMIQEDLARLRCFDTATGGAVRPAQPSQEHADSPGWLINEQDSPTDRSVTGLLRANRGDGSLVLRCRDERTEAQISLSNELGRGEPPRLIYWINDVGPVEAQWVTSAAGNSILASTVNSAVAFIRSLPDHGRLTIRIQLPRGEPHDATFGLGAVSPLRARIADACGWRP
jgi:hypothetical protein